MKSFFIGNIEIKTPVIQGGMGVGMWYTRLFITIIMITYRMSV